MLSTLLFCAVLSLVGLICVIVLYKECKPAHKLPVLVYVLVIVLTGMSWGRIVGIYQGQRKLLSEQKCLYRTEIQLIKGRDQTRPYSFVADTVYVATLNYSRTIIPSASPKYYLSKNDTLWYSATFNYQLK